VSELTPRHPAGRHYRRNVRNALVAAVVLHAIIFAAAPTYVPRPLRMRVEEMRVVNGAGFGEGWPSIALPGRDQKPPEPEARSRDRWKAGPPVAVGQVVTRQESPPSMGSLAAAGAGSGSRGGPSAGGSGGADGGDDEPSLFYAYDSPPRAIHTATPEYPAGARSAGVEGTVVVNVNVDAHGRVTRAWVATAEAPESLIEAALDASYQFEFTPGTMRDVPVPCTVAIPFQFSLRRTFQSQ